MSEALIQCNGRKILLVAACALFLAAVLVALAGDLVALACFLAVVLADFAAVLVRAVDFLAVVAVALARLTVASSCCSRSAVDCCLRIRVTRVLPRPARSSYVDTALE